MDCSVGMAQMHLGAPHCDPPVNSLITSYNPWKVDREAAGLLGLDWNNIAHFLAGFK